MPLSVLQVLCTPAFAGSRILSGWNGLGRTVACVTVAEVPDAAHWLSGGEIVLTTGYFMRQNPHALEDWFNSLSQAGASCIAIKPQRFFGAVPPELIQLADRLALPLVALPYTVSWPMIIGPVMESILFRSREAETESEHSLLGLFRQRAGFSTVAQTLANLINRTVIMEDTGGRLLGAGLSYAGVPSTRVVEERLSGSQPPLPHQPIDWLKDGHAQRWVERTVSLGGYTVHERIHPLVSGSDLRGYMTILTPGHAESLPDRLLEEWTAAVSLSFDRFASYRDRPLSETGRLLKAALVADGEGIAEADPELQQIVGRFGAMVLLEVFGKESALAVELVPAEAAGGMLLEDRLVKELAQWVHGFDPFGAVVPLETGVGLLVHPPSERGASGFLRTRADELLQVIRRVYPGVVVQTGVGQAGRGIDHYRRSLQQAGQALLVAKSKPGVDRIWFYDDLGVYRLLFNSHQEAPPVDTAEEILVEVQRVDRERDGELMTTLFTFCDHDGDLAKAARQLHVHPNTLRYRLRHIEKLTGLDYTRLEDLTQLYLAVKLFRLRMG